MKTMLYTLISASVALGSVAQAADVSVQPSAGSGFVVKDAGGTNERLRVQDTGVVTLAAVTSAPTQAQALCIGSTGTLGPCAASSGGTPLPVGTVNQTLRYNGSNTLVANPNLLAMADGSLAASLSATASGGSIAMGQNTQATALNSVALGGSSKATGIGAIGLGPAATASGLHAFAWGNNANATARDALALGNNASAGGVGSVAIGTGVTSTGQGSLVLGANADDLGLSNVFLWNGDPSYHMTTPSPLPPGTFWFNSPGGATFTSGAQSRYIIPASAGWHCSSDRNIKTAIVAVDSQAVLAKLVAMPVATWEFKGVHGSTHMGPMAQDFMAAFQLGKDDKTIGSTDAQGVAFAAIQGLNAKLEKSNARLEAALADVTAANARKDAEIAALQAKSTTQEARVTRLDSLASDMAAMKTELAKLKANAVAAPLYTAAQ